LTLISIDACEVGHASGLPALNRITEIHLEFYFS